MKIGIPDLASGHRGQGAGEGLCGGRRPLKGRDLPPEYSYEYGGSSVTSTAVRGVSYEIQSLAQAGALFSILLAKQYNCRRHIVSRASFLYSPYPCTRRDSTYVNTFTSRRATKYSPSHRHTGTLARMHTHHMYPRAAEVVTFELIDALAQAISYSRQPDCTCTCDA